MSLIASIRYYFQAHPILTLSAIAIIHRALILIFLLYLQPLVLPTSSHFDTSASLLDLPEWILPLVRWDVLHYSSIAVHGYRHEHELAFLPGWPGALRGLLLGWRWLTGVRSEAYGMVEVLVAGVLLSNTAAMISTILLYKIVLQLSSPPSPSRSNLESSADQLSEPSKYLALTASLIYILSPSPATIASGYTEPPFAAMTFSGILCLIHLNNPHNLGRWRKAFFGIGAAAAFAVATSLRSLGVLNVGMVGWLGVVIPLKRLLTPRSQGNMMSTMGTMILAVLSCVIIVSPFLIFQYITYSDFCLDSTSEETGRSWCNTRLPFAYSFVQHKYWDIGFLHYWTPAQIPNFALAMPVMLACLVGCWDGVKEVGRVWLPRVVAEKSLRLNGRRGPGNNQHVLPNNNSALSNTARHQIFLPLLVIHFLTTFILLFNSHVQIALRVAQTMPVLWMVVGEWVVCAIKCNGDRSGTMEKGGGRRADWGRWWIAWSMTWHGVGLVLWGAFLPPA